MLMAYCFIYVKEVALLLSNSKKSFQAFQNDLCIINYDNISDVDPCISSFSSSQNLWFTIEDTNGLISHLLEDYCIKDLCLIKDFPLTSTFLDIDKLAKSPSVSSQNYQLLLLVHQLIIEIADFLYGTPNIKVITKAEQICQYIHENVYGRITLEQLCNFSGLGKSRLISIFKATYEQSPIDYLLSQKVAEAKKRLQDTPQTISQIATDLGFYDAQHFIKVFKQHTGITPKKFRANYISGGHEP